MDKIKVKYAIRVRGYSIRGYARSRGLDVQGFEQRMQQRCKAELLPSEVQALVKDGIIS